MLNSLTCKANFLKGGSQKGTAENYNNKPSISVRFCGNVCMLLLFALHGAQLFFKQLPLRQIGCYGHKMLCESCRDNNSLSLLVLFFLSFTVTWTGIIASGTVQQATLHASFRGGLVAKHNLHWQVVHFFQILCQGKNLS